MNKTLTLKLFFIFILVLFFYLIFTNTNVYATDSGATTLTQEDFDFAKNNPDVDTGKIRYFYNNENAYYFMTKSNYVLAGDINIGAATIAFYSFYTGEDVSLDLSKYTIENGTLDEYLNAGIYKNKKVIMFQDVNAKITGTATIKSNSEDYAIFILEEKTSNAKNQEVSNINIQGGLLISETKAKVNNVNLENGSLDSRNSDVVITGGNYKNLSSSGAVSFNGSNATINGGTFTANLASAMYFFNDENDKTLTINGGTFTSAEDNGIEIVGGTINIIDGVFKGAMSGITIETYKTLKISGGTYEYTDVENGRGPIAMYNTKLEDAIAAIAENKVLSTGEFKNIEKVYEFPGAEPWTETYVTINAKSVKVQSKGEDSKEEDTPTPDTGNNENDEGEENTPTPDTGNNENGEGKENTPSSDTGKEENISSSNTNKNESSTEVTTTNPKTGDNIIIYSALFIIATIGIVLSIVIMRKEQTKEL